MNLDYNLFLQGATQSQSGRAVFVAEGSPATSAQLASAESTLGITLPPSYKVFLTLLGPGLWCDEAVKSPSALFAFDTDCWEMAGFVALVENVQGVGDHIAINPVDASESGERAVYYCGHDPFGYALLADSFEAWTRMSLQATLSDESPYAIVEEAVMQSYRRWRAAQPKPKAPKWQFWRK